MSSLSAVPSLATAKKAGLMTAGVSTADYRQANAHQAGYQTASAQSAAGAQANYTAANATKGSAQTAAGTQAQAYQADGVSADAKTRTLDQNELTSTNLDRILGEDSVLLQRARAIARERANNRGLMNSSMGVQAGTAAMIDAATPIAQSDAASQTNVLDRNLANTQETEIFNAGQAQQNNQFNADQLGTTSRFNANLEQQNNQFNAGEQNQMTMFNVGQENETNRFNAGQANDVSMYNANLTQNNNQFNAQQANQISQFNANAFNNNQQFNASALNNAEQFNANAYNQNAQFNANAQNENSRFNANAYNNNEQFNAQQSNQISVVNASEQNKILATMLGHENNLKLADIEAKYKTTMQTQSTAGSLYQQTMKDITDILVNPDLTQESKQAAVDQKYLTLENGLQFTQDVAGLDLDLNFNRPVTQSGISISDDPILNVKTLSNAAGITGEHDRTVLLNAPRQFVDGLLTTINQGHVANARIIIDTYNNDLVNRGLPALTEEGISKLIGAV